MGKGFGQNCIMGPPIIWKVSATGIKFILLFTVNSEKTLIPPVGNFTCSPL